MKKYFNVILVIVLAAAAFGIGYYDQTKLTKCEAEKKEAQQEEKETEVSYKVGEELVERIKNVYSISYYEYFKTGLDKIDNDLLIKSAIYAKADKNVEYNKVEVTKEKVKEYVTELFGEDYKYEDKDVLCPVDKEAFYIFKDGKYTYNTEALHGHGGGSTAQRDTKVLVEDVKYSGKDIVVTTRIAYAGKCGDTCGPLNAYYSYAHEVVYGNTSNDYAVTLTNNELKNIKDKLEVTTFTFSQNKDGSYYLSNVTVK